jgi:hypothetical protein
MSDKARLPDITAARHLRRFIIVFILQSAAAVHVTMVLRPTGPAALYPALRDQAGHPGGAGSHMASPVEGPKSAAQGVQKTLLSPRRSDRRNGCGRAPAGRVDT